MTLIFCPISQPFLPPLLPSSPSPTVGDSMEYPRVPGGYGEEAGKRERERETLSSTESTTPALFIPEYREIYRG